MGLPDLQQDLLLLLVGVSQAAQPSSQQIGREQLARDSVVGDGVAPCIEALQLPFLYLLVGPANDAQGQRPGQVVVELLAGDLPHHVALVDPFAAGLEPVNPELATSGTVTDDPSGPRPRGWWFRTWYEHDNLRDERAEAFTSLLWAGVYAYTYVARATTPGRFVIPPPRAEEMYSPETFGRGASDRMVIEAR